MQDARKIAEKIWERRELRDIISSRTLLELLLTYVGEKSRDDKVEPLSSTITQKVINDV